MSCPCKISKEFLLPNIIPALFLPCAGHSRWPLVKLLAYSWLLFHCVLFALSWWCWAGTSSYYGFIADEDRIRTIIWKKKKKKVWDIWFGYFFPLFSAIWWFASNVPSCWLPIEVSRFINNWIDFQYGLLLPWKKVFSREIGSSLFIYFLICIYLEGSTNPFLSYPI